MRTTVDLPAAAHRKAHQIAERTGRSLSAVIADLAIRGLAAVDEEQKLVPHPTTGFPTVTVGRPITAEDVASLDDDE